MHHGAQVQATTRYKVHVSLSQRDDTLYNTVFHIELSALFIMIYQHIDDVQRSCYLDYYVRTNARGIALHEVSYARCIYTIATNR